MGNPIFGLFEDPKQTELVDAIAEKTRQGRLRWNKSTTTYEASLPNGVQLIFALYTSIPFATKTWSHFTVRQRDGSETIKVQHTPPTPFFGLENAVKGALEVAAERLFAIVSESAKDEVDKVIDQVKRL
jgi:hypothetical protein